MPRKKKPSKHTRQRDPCPCGLFDKRFGDCCGSVEGLALAALKPEVDAEVARAEAIPDEEYFEQEDEVLTGDWLKMLQVKAREQSMVLLMQQQERQRWEERKAVVAGKLAAANAE